MKRGFLKSLFAGVFLCIACHTAVAGDTTPDYASMVDTRMGTVGKPGPTDWLRASPFSAPPIRSE